MLTDWRISAIFAPNDKNDSGSEAAILRALGILVLACALLGCGGPRHETPVSRSTMSVPRFGDTDPHDWTDIEPAHYPVHGIDVSKYQGEIDWATTRNSGVSFAFIKATEGGDYKDPMFETNWNAARNAGMPRGAYHYYYFCRSAQEQAQWFIEHVPRDGSALPPVIDMEWNHQSRNCAWRPDPQTVRGNLELIARMLAAHYGKRPMIYSTVDFFQENELWRVGGYPFWLRSVANHPSVIYPGQDWTFWQYSGTGMVDGIAGRTDLNVFAGSQTQWANWLSSNTR